MKKFNLKKIDFKTFFSGFKQNFPLIILALADVVVMAIPFYMENFIPNIYKNIGLSASEYSQASAIYGYVAIPSYLLGSYIGDKFKTKTLIVVSLIITCLLGGWYISLPITSTFATNSMVTAIQLDIIFAGFAFSCCGLFWGPLWKAVKNHSTEHIVGEMKERKVGQNNGYQGMMNGLIGLTLALFGTLLLELSQSKILPNIMINGRPIDSGFFILVTIYTALIVLSAVLALKYIKSIKEEGEASFSLKAIYHVLKNLQIWLLAFLVLGVYMLQMGLSSYVNYLSNIFLIPSIAVMILGIFRTYVMRFMVSGWFGKKADKAHSYIIWICLGLIVGIVLIFIGVVLPGFKNNFNPKDDPTVGTIVQVVACLNLVLLGALTWCLVTIRWSPLGAELKIENQNYAAGVNVISVIAFTPDAFFKQVKSAIEAKHNMPLVDPTTGQVTQVADQLGNQLILVVAIGMGLFGLISGIILYIVLYRQSDKFIFKKLSKKHRHKLQQVK
ncbi:MFS transporter [Williamsoniiplasma lucivorax]|uniref:Glycerophosphodiester transporter n=1 Tax=Williamsoniiplasma lucivorax TaxID=209274 RepID=A0A2S5RDU3_9MOLU|nr:MFS transporter [Williamsoniiplasma lucivorax]PPE05468.1 glycerophosphodiester transporter [Williamsoniiplasma lucivorax]